MALYYIYACMHAWWIVQSINRIIDTLTLVLLFVLVLVSVLVSLLWGTEILPYKL